MTDAVQSTAPISVHTTEAARMRLAKRFAAEMRYQWYGRAAIGAALLMLLLLLTTIISGGVTAFVQATLRLDVFIDPEIVAEDNIRGSNFKTVVHRGLYDALGGEFDRNDARTNVKPLLSDGAAWQLGAIVGSNPSLIGQKITVNVTPSDDIDQLMKGNIDRDVPESERKVNDRQIELYDQLVASGRLTMGFNTIFFKNSDSRQPELAGVLGAVVGSLMTLFITLILAVPIGVAAAVYLEEFAPKNKVTDLIEVNINNLAAVPSIVFGLLGLAVFLNFFGMPRSAPVVGGMVLALMTLPTVIISSRAALKAVPPSIRAAALGLGASKLQSVTHHVLPLALPGILTGSIIGMAQALGETAPLLMIGMVASITSTPDWFTDPSTVLPVQIYLWADSSERAFVERTSATIMVLLVFLVVMNSAAIWLRKRFERRW